MIVVWLGLGCTSTQTELLESLDGAWEGTANALGKPRKITAAFTYTEFLSGDLAIDETTGIVDYGVRRADAFNDVVALDLQQASGVQFLSLDGGMSEDRTIFSGQIKMTVECNQAEPCGYLGDFEISLMGPVDTGAPTKP